MGLWYQDGSIPFRRGSAVGGEPLVEGQVVPWGGFFGALAALI